jgi:hypothetical protein
MKLQCDVNKLKLNELKLENQLFKRPNANAIYWLNRSLKLNDQIDHRMSFSSISIIRSEFISTKHLLTVAMATRLSVTRVFVLSIDEDDAGKTGHVSINFPYHNRCHGNQTSRLLVNESYGTSVIISSWWWCCHSNGHRKRSQVNVITLRWLSCQFKALHSFTFNYAAIDSLLV